MKKRLMIIIVVAFLIITSIIVCVLKQQQSAANKDVTYTSQKGVLESGRKYHYFGTDNNTFNLQNYIKKFDLINITNYPQKVSATTPKEAAELSQFYFGLVQVPIESASIDVYYDVQTDTWVLIQRGVNRCGGLSILTIQRNDGTMRQYDDGLK